MQSAIFIFGVVVVCFLLVYAVDHLLPTGWGILARSFMTIWPLHPYGERLPY